MAAVPPLPADPEPLRRRLIEAALILGVALSLNLAGNARTSLFDRDEPRYAGCTREMRASGDWVHPTFNALPRYHKPILIYWLMLAGTAVGGDNPFGARLVSAIAGAATCLAAWQAGRSMFGRREGLLAGLILATAPVWIAESKLSTTDAALSLFLFVCQWALWRLEGGPSRAAAAAFWTALALATLTKGPVAPAFVATAGLASWWWRGPSACWRRLHWGWGLLGFTALAAPWYVAIGIITNGEFYRVAMGKHVVYRMTTAMETHGGFPGFYVVLSLLVFYPWSAFLPPALLSAWQRRKENPVFGFLLGWVVGPLVMLELIRTKLIHYYAPAYPACALLAAWMIAMLSRSELTLRRWPMGRLGHGLLAGIGIVATVGMLALAVVGPAMLRPPLLAMAAVAAATTLGALAWLQAGATERGAAALAGGWAVVFLLGGAWLLPAAEPLRLSTTLGRHLAAAARREGAVPAFGTYENPGAVYALGHPAPVLMRLDDYVGEARRRGRIIVGLKPFELERLEGDPRLVVDRVEVVRGFNHDKGRNEALTLAVIRPSASAVAGRPEQAKVE